MRQWEDATTPRLHLNVLGGLCFSEPDGGERRLPTRKARALATYLALHPGKRFARARLASLLWADETERAARHSLRQALSSIRHEFGPEAITADDEAVNWRAGALVVDAAEFEQLLRRNTLAAALAAERLYRGDFLDGHELGQPVFDDWLHDERERLKELAADNLGQILMHRALDPDLEAAVTTARRLIQLDPFDERAHRSLMQFYVRQARRARAIAHFQGFAHRLFRELGVQPDRETVALYEAIRADRPAAAPASLEQCIFVLEQMPHCVVVTDLNDRIVGWNKRAETEFGFTKADMCGRSPTLLYAPARDQSLASRITKLAVAHGKWSNRVRLLSKDGRVTYQVRTVAPLHDAEGQLIGAFGVGTPR